MNLLATIYFPSLCVAYIPIAFFSNHDFIDYYKIRCLYLPIYCLVFYWILLKFFEKR